MNQGTASTRTGGPPVDGDHDDLPGERLSVVVARSADELREHLPAWRRLVETALEPNVFIEPGMLLPAIELFGSGQHVETVLIYAQRRKNPAGPPVLCGLFPLSRRTVAAGALQIVTSWGYVHCLLSTPLVRADNAPAVIDALLEWLRSEGRAALWRLPLASADGPLHGLLVEHFHGRSGGLWLAQRYRRALFERIATADAYVRATIDRKRRHEIRRLEKRLAETGPLEYQSLAPDGDLDAWLSDFLQLEASGWKGRVGTALESSDQGRKFLRAAAQNAFAEGRLMMLRLRLGGRTIAQKCNFLARDGGFAFKIAFDEQYARYSPGVLLEMENIAALHRRGIEWMDSCALADHPMIDRLWGGRRTIESVWLATGRAPGELLLALAPLARWVRDRWPRRGPRRTS